MASGFGFKGGPGRCYPVWTQFTECMSQAPAATTCDDLRSDYFECLHHKKELVEVKLLKDEARVAHQKKLAEVAVISTGREGDYVAGKGETGGHTGFADKDAK